MKYKKMTLKDAFVFVHKKRSVIRPNHQFFSQLIYYEKKLFRKNTVQMIQITNFGTTVLIPDLYEKQFPELMNAEIFDKQIGVLKKKQIFDELSERSVI